MRKRRQRVRAARVATTALPRAEDEAIPIEGDWDCDEVANELDNCPQTRTAINPTWTATGIGDRCDENADNDDFPNTSDNCPARRQQRSEPQRLPGRHGSRRRDGSVRQLPTGRQSGADRHDRDSYGDACDADDDDDYHLDGGDNCPLVPNPGLADADRDGLGDACDPNTTILAPGPGPGTGIGPGTPADRRAPTVAVRAARVQRSADASGGMPVLVRARRPAP
jgi:hypothetical protein